MKSQLTRLAESILKDVEKQFGDRVSSWNFIEVQVLENGPRLLYHLDTNSISIALSKKVLEHEIQLLFQLSHEVCHLLHPSRKNTGELLDTLVINEGLSTFFQVNYVSKTFGNKSHLENDLKTYSSNYYEAYLLVQELEQIKSGTIKKLRSLQPQIDLLTQSEFDLLEIDIPQDLINQLLKKWNQA